MKRVLGLDLGTNSIGWALVNEKESEEEVSSIVKLGVRAIQYDTFSKSDGSESRDPTKDFLGGKGLSPNASRTQKRGARRNLQRYKLRRKYLISILRKNGLISEDTPLAETGKGTTHETLRLRAKSARSKVALHELARVLLAINKKRGYKSNRKAKSEGDGQAIEGIQLSKILFQENITPGEYVHQLLKKGKNPKLEFYRSDLQNEFRKVWDHQKIYYIEILTEDLFNELQDKNGKQTWAICKLPFGIAGISDKGSAIEKKKKLYQRRVDGLSAKLELEDLAIVFQEINKDISKGSGYLGAISDRSKELFFNGETVGEFLYNQLKVNPHNSLKNQVFYRQDYLDEFEKIWTEQEKHYPDLLRSIKKEVRDCIIFYQRPLKSQKALLSFCEFESWKQKYLDEKTGQEKSRLVGRRVVPKSSPLFQEFRLWQSLNNLEFRNTESYKYIKVKNLDDDIRQALFTELNIRGRLNPNDILKIIGKYLNIGKVSFWKSNLKIVEGNDTNKALYEVYHEILVNEGYGYNWEKKSAREKFEEVSSVFAMIGIDTSILDFSSDRDDYDKQKSYQLWHLLYSSVDNEFVSEDDKIQYGNVDVSLKKILHKKYGFSIDYAKRIASINFNQDYGNLSSKAIRKIIPFMRSGKIYSDACLEAGYNHSKSLTKEELKNRNLKPRLELLKKNELRNPVVEKILNQMVNVINQVIDTYGKPDEVRIELARELKKSADERAEMTAGIGRATKINEEIKTKIIPEKFGIPNPTRNDIIRYKLWKELESRGYKDLFRNKQIKDQDLFSKSIDIEHIIPRSLLFDDSFSNKTLAFKDDNIQKGGRTAFDFMSQDYAIDLSSYETRVENLFKRQCISKSKRNKLLMSQSQLPDDFIERDLRNSQYIARKAREMLLEVFTYVVPTTGSITDRLRQDWGIINVVKDLNFHRYKALGRIEILERKDGKKVEVIKDWTKREDHRHHAMDALTVAFTSHNHIQYLNNLNARKDEKSKMRLSILSIEKLIRETDDKGKGRFIAPIENMRAEAKRHIEKILISFKASNKVATLNKNKIKGKELIKSQLTPRGQLHKETVYGKIKKPNTKFTKLSTSLSLSDIESIVNLEERRAVLNHFEKFDFDPKLAFSAKTMKSNPIVVQSKVVKEVQCFEEVYTIRKEIGGDLKIDKVLDIRVQELLRKRVELYPSQKEAFSDLDKNPIWLNQSKRIAVKRVKIKGVNNAQPLHLSKDHFGEILLDENNNHIPIDFVSTGNNHHVAIYQDSKGNLQEKVASFFDVVCRVNQELNPIDYEYNSDKGWRFLFTMKKDEMFLFPNKNDDFYPDEINWRVNDKGFYDIDNPVVISKNLFRVQKIATRNYMFRHHLETSVSNDLDFAFKLLQSTPHLKGIVKVRLNHIGNIVHVGEY